MGSALMLSLVFPDKAGLYGYEVNTKHSTHRWQARVPCGCVIAAGTYADITVVNLGCTEAMGSPHVFQFFVLLPS